MGQVLFVVANLSAAVIAFVIAGAAMTGREPWRQALAALAGFPIVILAVLLILGSFGQISSIAVTVVTGALACAAMAACWKSWRVRAAITASAEDPSPASAMDHVIAPLSLAFIGGFGGGWIVICGLSGTRLIVDDLSYHATAVAHWIIDGRLSLAPLNYHAYFPLNAEILSLWFMLPFHSDGAASLSGLYWGVLLVSAGICLIVSQTESLATAMFAGALLLISPVLIEAARTFSAVDLAGPALIMAALAFTIPSRGARSPNTNSVDAAYAGLLAGFAAGCKISFFPVVPVILLWQACDRRRRPRQFRAQIWTALALGLGAAATGAFWYARNWVLTGNPIFPASFWHFDGPFGAEQRLRTELIHWIVESRQDWGFLLSMLKRHTEWPAGLFLLAAVGYGATFWRDVLRRRHTDVDSAAVRQLLLLVGCVLLLAYPFMPFSATYNEPHGAFTVSLRYLIAPYAIGVVLFGAQIGRDNPHRVLWLCVALMAAATSAWSNQIFGYATLGSALAVLWSWQVLKNRAVPRPAWSILRTAALPAVLVLFALLMPYKQRQTDEYVQTLGGPRHPIGQAWQALENLPSGAHVAWFGPDTYQYYPIFGRRLQLNPTSLDGDGSPYEPMHEEFRRQPFQWWDSSPAQQDLADLAPRLRRAGVDYVLITKRAQDEWPLQHAAIAAVATSKRVYDDGFTVIWKIGGAQ